MITNFLNFIQAYKNTFPCNEFSIYSRNKSKRINIMELLNKNLPLQNRYNRIAPSSKNFQKR